MSYSRRELGFVDDLVGKLEAESYNVWLDYRALIPGAPWGPQIQAGLEESDTVLLVISQASLASKYVTSEWHHFLDTKKRVILLIFEAVDLPKELEQFEWVDFRGSYKGGLQELFSQLKQAVREDHTPPETGFKAPLIVWAAIAISIIVALLSLSEIWTIFIPWLLVPLPYRIYKRNFNFTEVQTALWALPIASLLSVMVYDDPSLDTIVWMGFVFGLILLFILRSPAMQRWGRPEAIIPKYINPHNPKIENPVPVPFYVDYVVQDGAIAKDLIETLKKYGHPQVERVQDAKAVFALISQFKSDTDADPTSQMVFPILIQTNENISEKLSKIQWIDFRPGVRGLEAIAQLLPRPKELLKALGMRPVSNQKVYSPFITALYFFIVFLSVVNIGSSLDYIFASDALFNASDETFLPTMIGFVLNMILFSAFAYFMVRGLTSRKGIFSSLPAILGGVLVLGLFLFGQFLLDSSVVLEMADAGINPDEISLSFVNLAFVIYFVGIFAAGFVYLRNLGDAHLWFPAKKA
jgi:hypothetical protein